MALGDTTELLSDIRERGSIPSGDLRFTDAKLLAAATKELREGCVPLLHQAKSEHLVTSYSVAVTSGTSTYRVPPRAIGGGGLRDVVWQGTGGQKVSLREVPVEELPDYGTATGTPFGYYLRGYNVELVPTPNVTGTLYLPYYARPNELVVTSGAATVVSVNGITGEIELSSVTPLGLTPGMVGSADMDFIRATPAFELLFSASEITVEGSGAIAAGQVDPTASDIVVGDYVCLLGKSPVVQLPVEMLGLLAVRTARRALKASGDAKWRDLDEDVAELEQRARTWLSPRNDGEVASVSPLFSGIFGCVLTGQR